MRQNPQFIPNEIPVMSVLEITAWVLGAMGALCGIILRQGYKGFSAEMELKMDAKQKIQEKEFDKKLEPMVKDLHDIKNHLATRESIMLQVHDVLSKVNEKL